MSLVLSEQQLAFYTKNGFLELEGLFSDVDCVEYLALIRQTIQARPSTADASFVQGRDLWRDAPVLKTLLCSKKLSGLAFAATGKSMLRLAFDQWFEPGYFLQTPQKIKDLFSIQGVSCAIFIQFDEAKAQTLVSPLGLSPFPQKRGGAMLVGPALLLNWPPSGVGLYVVAYALPASVYVHNPRDPAGVVLRQYGYGYGDPLRSDTHPIVSKQ